VARLGAFNGLGQLLLKLVAPGVPDFYQGTELWSLTLVDPDNRRPVDYERRRTELEAIRPLLDRIERRETAGNDGTLTALVDHWHDGRLKLHVTACGLHARRAAPHLFLKGDYVPLHPDGARATHLVAFGRAAGDDVVVAAVPRLTAALAGVGSNRLSLPTAVWADTRIPLPDAWSGRRWRSALTGAPVSPDRVDGRECLPAPVLFSDLPVALLRVEA